MMPVSEHLCGSVLGSARLFLTGRDPDGRMSGGYLGVAPVGSGSALWLAFSAGAA
jgi:hypothetical protein